MLYFYRVQPNKDPLMQITLFSEQLNTFNLMDFQDMLRYSVANFIISIVLEK